jgi:hypothetical protein
MSIRHLKLNKAGEIFSYQLYFMSPEFSEEIHRYRRTIILLLYLHTDRGLESHIQKRFTRLKECSFVGENVLRKQVKEAANQLETIELKDPVSSTVPSTLDNFPHQFSFFCSSI